MAQGLALAVFVWLSEAEGDPIYAEAATMTFNSFTNNRVSTGPWTVWVDGGGYLWLEEYPRAIPDQTINGSLFASFGLYEYFRWSGEAAAKKLIEGAYTTLRHYLPTIRTGWISYYCLSHRVRNGFYHLVVTSQLNKIYAITGHTDFADWTEQFQDDYPDYRLGGTVRFEAGRHTGYRFGSNGAITGSLTVAISSRSSAVAGSRRTIEGRAGTWFEMTSGAFAGYFIPELTGKSYLPGTLPWPVAYNPPRSIWLSPGTYTAYQFSVDGSVASTSAWSVSANTGVTTSQRAIINGAKFRQVAEGPLAGRWLAIGSGSSRALIDRLGGQDRYATAAAISTASFDPGVPVAYLATGLDFPDALVGGPAAAKTGGPILLVQADRIPQPVVDELRRLKPARIVLLGSAAVVGDPVAAAAAALAPSVSRLAGADRYATAAAVSAATFQPGVGVVYLATGLNFPDALGAGAAAVRAGGTVLLVKPDGIPAVTAAELTRLRPARITVVGSNGVVSDVVLNAARTYAPSVSRLAGPDRYATAVAISRAAFGTMVTGRAFVAVGEAFPDGLAVSAVAGRVGAPVLLVPKTNLLPNVAAELQRLGPDRVTVLGSSAGAISDAVAAGIRNLWP
jgi:putative cell wall-binding protein